MVVDGLSADEYEVVEVASSSERIEQHAAGDNVLGAMSIRPSTLRLCGRAPP